jgi:tripeptide aminopeptidase
MTDVVKTFLELVKIDSPSGEEDGVRECLVKKFNKLGISSEVDSAGNLFAKVNGRGQPLILSAHMDTVEPGRGVKPKIEKGTIKSDGTTILGADNKSTVAAIIVALEKVKKEKRHALEVVFSVREETDSGIEEFDMSKLNSKYGLIADRSSPLGSVVLASPWIENIDIKITGKTAHAGVPEKGVNALTTAAYAITSLMWGRVNETTTANIGIIEGGSAMNSIPGEVKLIGEVRSFSENDFEGQIGIIRKGFEKAVKTSGAKLEFGYSTYCSGYNYGKDSRGVRIAENALKKGGLTVSYEKSFSASDANAFSKNGVQVVNIGDATKDPHTVKERITVKDLERLTEVFINYIT